MSALVVCASAVLADGRTWLEGGGLLVERGRITRLLRSRAAVQRARRAGRWVDAGDVVLTPGLVNAHVHLELSGLRGRLSPGASFSAWVAGLLELRAKRGPRGLAADARWGAERCLASGTTLVADVDTTGAAERGLRGSPLRIRLFREVLDAQDPGRTAAALARLRAPARRTIGFRPGLSPHAPYSVSPALLRVVGRTASRKHLPVSIHWAETVAELEWLLEGTGPLAGLLGRSPRRSGLDLLEEAGLLGERLSLIHGNWPARGEPARIAAAGATLVHCPGSHAWFDREPFPLERYRRAGVRLALGSDSLASNADLDLGREMALLRSTHPGLAPERVWRMATEAGARSVGFEGEAGVLRPGALADAVAWRVDHRSRRAALEALTRGSGSVARVWIGGVEVDPPGAR